MKYPGSSFVAHAYTIHEPLECATKPAQACPSRTVSHEYDELDRLKDLVASLVGQPANLHTSYDQDWADNRQDPTQPNASTMTYQCDRRNRLKNLAHKTAAAVMMLGLTNTVADRHRRDERRCQNAYQPLPVRRP